MGDLPVDFVVELVDDGVGILIVGLQEIVSYLHVLGAVMFGRREWFDQATPAEQRFENG